MKPEQTLSDVSSVVLKGLEQMFAEWMPDLILVRGDTTTIFVVSLVGYYHKD